MASKNAATIRGIALAPGISKNNRSYSREAIARMVQRAQERISSGTGLPLVMKTSHEVEDATKVVGKLTAMRVDEAGAAQFTADIANTKAGKTVAKLVKGGFLRGVSIRGAWIGKTRTERGPAGQPVETGDDLELFGLDYTPSPGVAGARITAAESAPTGQIREDAPLIVPAPTTPTSADLAKLSQEDWEAHTAEYWRSRLSTERPRSPFWAGLEGPPPAA